MQSCINGICMHVMYVLMNEYVWDSYDSMTVWLLRQDWAG